jgi:hypothetical protein
MKRVTAIFLLVIFGWSCVRPPTGLAQAQSVMQLMPEPGTLLPPSEAFTPAYLQGVTIDPMNALKFDFLIRKGDAALTPDQKQEEYTRLVKYFLTALTIPDTDQWVNLSPYEGDRLVDDQFGLTAMGRDLLAQDYLLKQLAASLTHPDTELGKKYWSEFYRRAHEKFGSADVPLESFNKVWIIPDTAVVYEKGTTAYLLTQRLRVMTERDYLAYKSQAGQAAPVLNSPVGDDEEFVRLSSEVLRDVIVPEIEREVNQGKSFTVLRQICTAMVLATWYKRALKESILGRVYADQSRVAGIDQSDCSGKGAECSANRMIWEQYMEAFRKGVFNMIREDVDQYSQELIPRKYFSGGLARGQDPAQLQIVSDYAALPLAARDAARQLEDAAFDSAAALLEPKRMGDIADAAQNGAPVSYVLPLLLESLGLDASDILGRDEVDVPEIEQILQEGSAQADGERSPIDIEAFNVSVSIMTKEWRRLLPAFDFSAKQVRMNPDDVKDINQLERLWNEVKQLPSIRRLLTILMQQSSRVNPANEVNVVNYVLRALARVWAERQRPDFEVRVTPADFVAVFKDRAPDIFDALLGHGLLLPDQSNDRVAYFDPGLDIDRVLTDDQFGRGLQLSEFRFDASDIRAVLTAVQARSNIDAGQAVSEAASLQNKDAVGGIDLNSANWDMQIRRDGKGVPLPVAQQDLESLQVDGFVPTILSIRPVAGISI